MTAVVYTNNFESGAAGSTPAEWVNVSPATWQLQSQTGLFGVQALGDPHAADGDVALLSGTGAPAPVADGDLLYATLITDDGSGNPQLACPIFRMDSGYTNGYLIVLGGTLAAPTFVLFKRVSGAYSAIGSGQSIGAALTAGERVFVRAAFAGTSITAKIWQADSPEPASAQGSWTDSTYTAAGYTGYYNGSNGKVRETYVDAITVTSSAVATAAAITADDAHLRYTGAGALTGAGASSRWTTINSGGIIDIALNVTDAANSSVSLNFALTGVTVPPRIRWSVDGGTKSAAVPVNGSVAVAASLSAGAHTLRVWVDGLYEGAGAPWANTDEWTSKGGALSFVGLTVGTGVALTTAAAPSVGEIEFLGDSITASVRLLYTGSGSSDQTVMDSAAAWPQKVCDSLGTSGSYLPIVRGFGGTGLTVAGSGGVPASGTNFPYCYAGQAYTPPRDPKAVVLYLGTNDGGSTQSALQSAYLSYLQQIRTARPTSKVLVIIPAICTDFRKTAIQGAFTSWADAASALYDGSGTAIYIGGTGIGAATADTTDGIHLNATTGTTKMANAVTAQLNTLLGLTPALTPGTATAGSVTSTTAAATATDATGGTPPYTYQWYRSTASGTLGSAVTGQTTRNLADSGLTAGTDYYDLCRYTDSAGAHVDSNQIHVTTSAASPAVSGVTISPAAPSIVQGGWQHFTASVQGSGSPAQTVTWTLSSGAQAAGLILDTRADGSADVLVPATVALGTLAGAVIATSAQDSTKSGSASVTVTAGTGVGAAPGTPATGTVFRYTWIGNPTVWAVGLPESYEIRVEALAGGTSLDATLYAYEAALVPSQSGLTGPNAPVWADVLLTGGRFYVRVPANTPPNPAYYVAVRVKGGLANGDSGLDFCPTTIRVL